MVIGFIQAVNLFSSPFKILISWFFLRRVGTKNSFLWISLSSLKIWLSKAKQWDWMKLVCEKGEGLQANILACVYLMGKKSMAKSTWTFGYLPDNFQLYISRETMKLEKKLWESICAGAGIQPFGKPILLLMFFCKNTSWNKSKNYFLNLLISRDFLQQFNTLLFQDTKAVPPSD